MQGKEGLRRWPAMIPWRTCWRMTGWKLQPIRSSKTTTRSYGTVWWFITFCPRPTKISTDNDRNTFLLIQSLSYSSQFSSSSYSFCFFCISTFFLMIFLYFSYSIRSFCRFISLLTFSISIWKAIIFLALSAVSYSPFTSNDFNFSKSGEKIRGISWFCSCWALSKAYFIYDYLLLYSSQSSIFLKLSLKML